MTLSESTNILRELYDFLYYGVGAAEMGIAGIMLVGGFIVSVITAFISFCIRLLVFILEAIPLYKVARKMERKCAWLAWMAWIPGIGSYLSTFVLTRVPGDKPLQLVKKVKINNRLLSFWIYVGIALFGPALISVISYIFGFIPVLGQIIGIFSIFLKLIPAVAAAWMEFAYLRDVLDIFKPDKKANLTAAIIVAILDALVTFGLARAFFLYTIINKDPLPQPVDVTPAAEA